MVVLINFLNIVVEYYFIVLVLIFMCFLVVEHKKQIKARKLKFNRQIEFFFFIVVELNLLVVVHFSLTEIFF